MAVSSDSPISVWSVELEMDVSIANFERFNPEGVVDYRQAVE